jgi:sugar phosphate isomerase/epimerase
MLIGFTVDQYRRLPIWIILRTLRWSGVSFSEVTSNVFLGYKKALRSARGMSLGLHLPNFGNCGYDFSSLGSKERIETVLSQIELIGKRFDFRYAVFHPPEADSSGKSFDFYIENLLRVGIPLVLENVQGFTVERFVDFYRYANEKLQGRIQGVCLDIPHAYLTGEDWQGFYQTLSSEIKVVHLTDCRDDIDFHLPFGIGGDLCLEEILKTLQMEGFDGMLNFEMLPPSLGHLDAYFKTYLRAREFFDPKGLGRVRRRMKLISFVGRVVEAFLRR